MQTSGEKPEDPKVGAFLVCSGPAREQVESRVAGMSWER